MKNKMSAINLMPRWFM